MSQSTCEVSNNIFVIKPYKDYNGELWVFDDICVDLVKEPFVPSAGAIIDKLVEDADIKNAGKGFLLLFSAQNFDKAKKIILVDSSKEGGSNYYSEDYKMTGWLCPALFKYFETAPKELYVLAINDD